MKGFFFAAIIALSCCLFNVWMYIRVGHDFWSIVAAAICGSILVFDLVMLCLEIHDQYQVNG